MLLTAEERERVAVVLVRARNPNNIGAVARAMHDFGFGELRLVSDFLEPVERARSAVDADAVIAGAQTFLSLGKAIADATLVVGTTAVGERALEHRVRSLPSAAEAMAEHLRADPAHRVALLFGSEKTGLSNEELSHCDELLTIPMALQAGVRHPSMNLGQAAAVCLWELVRERPFARADGTAVQGEPARATAAAVARLEDGLRAVLERSGYVRRHPGNSGEEQVRRLLRRAAPRAADVPVWLGVVRQVLWAINARGQAPGGSLGEGSGGPAEVARGSGAEPGDERL